MSDENAHPHPVNAAPSEAKPNPLFGSGATRAEKCLATLVGLLGAAGIAGLAIAYGVQWNWVQYILAMAIAFDVTGGVVANGLNSAKRDHFGPGTERPETRGMKLVRRPVLFTALHVHPIVIALAFSATLWWWGVLWYLFTLAGTATVRRTPLYLQRPVALAFCAFATMAAFFIPAPELWAWFPVMLTMKLVLAHAVQEEPYRPASDAA